jgi:hypothetical protein
MSTEIAREQLLQAYSEADDAHTKMHGVLATTQEALNTMNPAFVVDAVFALKRISELFDETRKKIDKVVQHGEKLGCALVVSAGENELQGQWASGTAQTSSRPGVPHPDREPEQYVALMTALGVPEHLIAEASLTPRFDAVGNVMNKLAEEGKPIPEGLKHARMFPTYTVAARSKVKGGMGEIVLRSKLNQGPIAQAR